MAIIEVGQEALDPQAQPELNPLAQPELSLVPTERQGRVSFADVVANQMRMPRGLLAPLAARSLNRRNQGLIGRTIAALDVNDGHRVLDVGFGGGISLGLLTALIGTGQVAGIDPSPEMVTRACRVFADELRRERLSVGTGSVGAIPFGDATFDRAITCQTVYFWADLKKGLEELHRVLVPGGRLAVAMMPKALQQRYGFVARGYRVVSHPELMAALEETGFTEVQPWPPHVADPRWIVVAQRP